MSDLEKLEKQAEVLMRHLESNSKKIRQQKLKDDSWDSKRLDANLRITRELKELTLTINKLKEKPEQIAIVG